MNKKISKKKNVEVAFINVSLYPTEKQKPEEYVKLLSSIMGSRVMIQSSTSDRSTLLREFDKYGDHYHGFFVMLFSQSQSLKCWMSRKMC